LNSLRVGNLLLEEEEIIESSISQWPKLFSIMIRMNLLILMKKISPRKWESKDQEHIMTCKRTYLASLINKCLTTEHLLMILKSTAEIKDLRKISLKWIAFVLITLENVFRLNSQTLLVVLLIQIDLQVIQMIQSLTII